MSEEQDSAAATARRSTIERSTRPSAARPTSCSTHGAARRARPDAPLGRPRPGRGRPGPVPGHEARHRPGHRRRLLLRLRAAAAADARRPAAIEARMRESIAADHPFVRQRAVAGRRRARSSSSATSRSRSRSSTTSLADAERDGDADARRRRSTSRARSSTCAAARTSRAPARSARSSCSATPARTGAATRSGRCSSASTARSGRPRRSSTSTSGGARRRRSATTAGSASSSTCSASTTSSPGSAFWHPKGQRIWRTLEGAMRELQERRGYQEVSTPILVSERLWRQSGHWDLYRDNMFIVESEGQTFSLKPMNCPETTFIYRSHLRSYRDLPLRFNEYGRLHRNERSGTLQRPDPRPPVHPGRRAHLRPAGPADATRSRRCSARSARRTAGSGSSRASRSRPSRTRRSATRRSGSGPRSSSARRSTAADITLRRQAQGRHVLRAQDRHLHRRRARARVADGDHPGRPRRCCPSGST